MTLGITRVEATIIDKSIDSETTISSVKPAEVVGTRVAGNTQTKTTLKWTMRSTRSRSSESLIANDILIHANEWKPIKKTPTTKTKAARAIARKMSGIQSQIA